MRKEEILLNEPEIVETKPRKVKIALSILVSTLIVAATTILLVGHFKYDWFKINEYKIDANINRSVYQANYFSEVKTISTKFNFDGGHEEKKRIVIDNNFAVFLTEKKDNLNTAVLVLLSATATVDDKIQELSHLDMFDEEQVKELEANPNGAKYPMGVFKFTDDGKIEEINLPDNIDEYNAETIIEFIKKVIPQLSRNKEEDMSNGLEITTKKVNNKRTIVQKESPKQIKGFRGSRYTRLVKTEIENEQVTNVQSEDNLYMESKPEANEITYGPKDFSYDIKSKITTNEVRYNEKESIELVNKLAKKFTLIESEALLELFAKNKEENKFKEEAEEETKPLRNLFAISASKSFPIASFDVLGTTLTVKYEVGVSSNQAYNKIVFTYGGGSFQFGNTGCSGEYNYKQSYNQDLFIAYLPFPFSFVSIRLYVKGSISAGFGFKSGSGSGTKYWAKASGSLDLGAKAQAGFEKIASLAAYAQGTVISASGQLTISNGSISKDSGFQLRVGRLEVGITGSFAGKSGTLWSKTLFEGWTIY